MNPTKSLTQHFLCDVNDTSAKPFVSSSADASDWLLFWTPVLLNDIASLAKRAWGPKLSNYLYPSYSLILIRESAVKKAHQEFGFRLLFNPVSKCDPQSEINVPKWQAPVFYWLSWAAPTFSFTGPNRQPFIGYGLFLTTDPLALNS